MQPSQRNYSPTKVPAPTTKSPRLYGGAYGSNDHVAVAPGSHHSPRRAPNKYNSGSYSVGPSNAAAPEYEDQRQMIAPHSAPQAGKHFPPQQQRQYASHGAMDQSSGQ